MHSPYGKCLTLQDLEFASAELLVGKYCASIAFLHAGDAKHCLVSTINSVELAEYADL